MQSRSFGQALTTAVLAGGLLAATSASALTISTVTVTKNAGNTANFKNDTLTDYREFNSTVTVLDSGGTVADGIGNNVDGKTRYAATTDADSGVFTSLNYTATSDYKVTFTVSAGLGWFYDVAIDTSRMGALTRVDDGSANASATIGAVTGKLNGSTNGTLALGSVALANGGSAANTTFSQAASTLTISGLTGTNVITLDFAWTSSVTSSSGLTGGDEVAVRLGVADTTSGSSAGDYPGVGSRTIGNDGHFVTFKATTTSFIPEPGSALLTTIGLAGLAWSGRRRVV